MDKDKQSFTRESIDDDIDQLIKNSSMPSDLDAQLVSELRHIYKEDAASLTRVWQRLEHHSSQRHTSPELIQKSTPQRQTVASHIVPLQKRNSRNIKYPVSQLFRVLAATIVGVFLVGSLTWILAMTHITAPGATRQIAGESSATSQAALITSPKGLLTIRMLDHIHGWALTSHAILKTSDGGKGWQDVSPQVQTPGMHFTGEFLIAQDAWIAWQAAQADAAITILHTSNGGTSWQTATINNVVGELIDVPRFINAQQGWLVTSQSEGMMHSTIYTYQTTDGGQTWTKISVSVNIPNPSSSLSFSNAQLGWIGLNWPGNHPVIGKTVNGGQSWQQLSLPNPTGTTIFNAQTDAPVLIGANGLLPAHLSINSHPQVCLTLYITHDDGTSWTVGTSANFDSTDVYTIDVHHVWAEETMSNTLHISSDGGMTWSQTIRTPQHFDALSFVDTKYGWAIDDTGLLYQTIDGGVNWQRL